MVALVYEEMTFEPTLSVRIVEYESATYIISDSSLLNPSLKAVLLGSRSSSLVLRQTPCSGGEPAVSPLPGGIPAHFPQLCQVLLHTH